MIKETIKIYLTNGGSIDFEATTENKELVFSSIDTPFQWLTIGAKTINTNQITYFEITKENTI